MLPMLRDHLLSTLLNIIISHTLQASFSPKALHCAIEHTLSNSRKTMTKTSTGLCKDTSSPNILLIKGSSLYIKRKYLKVTPKKKKSTCENS